MKQLFLLIICLFTFSLPAVAQQQSVSGKVLDFDGNALSGVTVTVQGTSLGVLTDGNGDYSLNNVSVGSVLQFEYPGYASQTHIVTRDKPTYNAILIEDATRTDEVTIVAFGQQKKESVVSSITTVNTTQLKMPTSNLTTSFAGQMAGMISYQSSGEPGADNADFFIRGVTSFGYNTEPLYLVDNIEISKDELARIQVDDIESFSILKDASATALYGARGANGVIMIKTKEGTVGKAQLSIRVENSMSQPTKNIQLADNITYMRMHNEATVTRDIPNTPPSAPPYSDEKIDNTALGRYPILYPSNNWRQTLMKDQAWTHRVNMSVKGGGQVARYYVGAAFTNDTGVLKVDPKNNFNNNINLSTYTLRSNVNVNVTKSTELKVSLDGTFEDYNGPLGSGSAMYGLIMRSNPVLFPAVYPVDEAHKFVQHTMFGNTAGGTYLNPYAEMVRGYREYNKSIMGAQLELKQNLEFLLKGLNFRVLFNTKREARNEISRSYKPYYYELVPGSTNYLTGAYAVEIVNPDIDGETLSATVPVPNVVNTTYLESALQWGRTFNEDHDVNAQLIFTMRNRTVPTTNNESLSVMMSLPFRNMGLAGRFTYAYKSRYFLEGNFGYNGSERFDAAHRWGFFPSMAVGWMISNENFFRPLKKTITMLKLRGSYGMAGNDKIGNDGERFLYLSNISLNNSTMGYSFGNIPESLYSRDGISISRYADPTIGWEIAYKTNIALELTLFNSLDIIAEYYTERRTNILQSRTSIPHSMGLWATPRAGLGEAFGEGTDISLTYNFVKGKNFWAQARVNFTYAVSRYTKYEDYDYKTEWWKLRVGNSVNQRFGYIAEGLFIDDAEVTNSPQQFGLTTVRAGDIKYRDLNGDGIISDLDMAPIGYPTVPEIQYGFGASLGWKNIDFSFFFNGVHNRSFFLDYTSISPFFGTGTNNALMSFIADSYWSEDNRNPYAVWPRLAITSGQVTNNNPTTDTSGGTLNTWFLRDGAFLRLKSVELGYTLPRALTGKIGLEALRVYGTATNLFTISKFKLWDPEMAGNGLQYPIQRTFNIGLQLTF